jgi:hypothetical protein
MSVDKNIHHLQEVHDHSNDQHGPWHRLKRIHHSWIFWIFVLLMLAAIIFYIMSDGFSLVSPNHTGQPIESPVAP